MESYIETGAWTLAAGEDLAAGRSPTTTGDSGVLDRARRVIARVHPGVTATQDGTRSWLALRHGVATLKVEGLSMWDRPLLRVFAEIAHGLTPAPDLFEQLNGLNSGIIPDVTLSVRCGRGVGTVDIGCSAATFGSLISDESIAQCVARCAWVANGLIRGDYIRRFGGQAPSDADKTWR